MNLELEKRKRKIKTTCRIKKRKKISKKVQKTKTRITKNILAKFDKQNALIKNIIETKHLEIRKDLNKI